MNYVLFLACTHLCKNKGTTHFCFVLARVEKGKELTSEHSTKMKLFMCDATFESII
jgi:hypothetical protein